ncbi:hypothetical protein [Nocardioides nitrophenolicus]|uniref:hypothetical protein n=1 Tax=Nocardioides nitrophenolicus TaxID=60489 RepID=UPI00195C9461|nr:hypothetical protein [Nocardioides nitrophenolicus]MBM7519925.1 hypothetical protein [Nocardioides nitrophenolicus]
MKLSRVLAVLCAATLAPLALAVPPAHADQHYSGVLDSSDPPASVPLSWPDYATDTCGPGDGSYTSRVDKVSFVSTTDGPRRFVLIAPSDPTPPVWVFRNGVCVAADYAPDDDSDWDPPMKVDVDGVQIAKGDRVDVYIGDEISESAGRTTPWTLDVLQPGSNNGPGTGKATKYVALPAQVLCGTGTAHAKLTKKGKRLARSGVLTQLVFRAGGVKVAKVKARGMRKAARKGVLLRGVPASATSVEVVVKVKGAKKRRASRAYSSC